MKTGDQRRGRGLLVALAALIVFGLFYAAQYRAMMIFYSAVILITLWASPARPSQRFTYSVVLMVASVTTLIIVSTVFPSLKLLKVFDLVEDTTPIMESGKIQAVKNLWSMYGDMPETILVGAAPLPLRVAPIGCSQTSQQRRDPSPSWRKASPGASTIRTSQPNMCAASTASLSKEV